MITGDKLEDFKILLMEEYLNITKVPVTKASITRLRRMCSGGSSKKSCPFFFNKKHIFSIARGDYRIRYSPSRGWPEIKRKP